MSRVYLEKRFKSPNVRRSGRQAGSCVHFTIVLVTGLVLAVPAFAVPATNAATSNIKVKGRIEVACSGAVSIRAHNGGSSAAQFERVVDGKVETFMVKPRTTVIVVREADAGDVVILRGPADGELARATIPSICDDARAHIHIRCRDGHGRVWFDNRTMAPQYFMGYVSEATVNSRTWLYRVKPGNERRTRFNRAHFYPGTVLGTALTDRDGTVKQLLDFVQVPERC